MHSKLFANLTRMATKAATQMFANHNSKVVRCADRLIASGTISQRKAMKPQKTLKIAQACLAAVTLFSAVSATNAATPAPISLQGRIELRPVTPQDKKDYALPASVQISGGMPSVGVGQPVNLEALSDYRIARSGITVTWLLTNTPSGSTATLEVSPLGTNVPTYRLTDRTTFQLLERKFLRPDVAGQYTVIAMITTLTNGTTNLTQKITAGTYMGSSVCSLCHSGSTNAADIYTPWAATKHARAFKEAIDGVSTDHFGKNCISCHVVGFDTNALAANNGFDDVMVSSGWIFPTNFTNGTFASMPAELQNLANIQCESCHGPGSEHVNAAIYPAFTRTNLANWPRIGATLAAGSCVQCHDSLSHHYKTAEWKNSRHAIATRSPSGAGRDACIRCHTAKGFVDFISSGGTPYVTNTVYEAITCAACHSPHSGANAHQLRSAPLYTLPEGTTVTNAGLGALCMQCHHSRNGAATNNVLKYSQNLPTWDGGVSFGPHDSTAGEMIEGVGGITYGRDIPSGTHSITISNTCVGCHMQPVASTDPAFTKAGGHTFSMNYTVITNNTTNVVAKVDVCVKCHGAMEDFNLVRKDYNGDGVIEGIQTEVQLLLNKLTTLLPNSTYRADGKYVADGLVKAVDRNSTKTNWPVKFLNAAWNHMFVNVEGSHGIHNAPYAVGLLKASIADLTDDWNNDGMPDTWQIANFGSITNPLSAPKATPANDGIPNWLKYNLGLNPMTAGLTVPGGVVYANGTKLFNSADTNTTLKIYTAAEVAFNGEVGKTYQIQGISAINGTWMNLSSNIAGTGGTISYVTPIRTNVQQYFRVISTP
jgi:hypothetical protein